MRLRGLGRVLLLAGFWTFGSTVEAQTLLELYRHALQTNPALKGREHAVDRAGAQQDQALGKLLPNVSVVGNYSRNEFRNRTGPSQDSLFYSGSRTGLQASQPILDLPSYYRLQGAKAATRQSERELEATRVALTGDLIDRYLKVLEVADELAQIRAEKDASAIQVRRIRAAFERQLAKVTDLYEAEAYEQSLVTAEIDASNRKSIALEKLRELSGVAPRDVAPLARERFPPVARSADEWVAEATRNSPALAALEHAVDSARQGVASRNAEHLPRLDLTLSQTYADTGFDNRESPPYAVGTLGLQLSVPLYAGGGIVAGEREAEARHRIAREQHEEQRRKIELEARTAHLNAVTNHARIDSTSQEVRFRERAVTAQERGYELRVATIIDVLEAKRRLFKARTEQSKARYDYIRSVVALRQQAGSLSLADVEEVSGWMGQSPGAAR